MVIGFLQFVIGYATGVVSALVICRAHYRPRSNSRLNYANERALDKMRLHDIEEKR